MADARPRIVVTRTMPEPAMAVLRTVGDVWSPLPDRQLSREELYAAIAGADAVVNTLWDRVDRAFADAAGPRLRIVSTVAVGYDNIDVPALTGRGVVVTNTPGVLTDATADIAFGLLLSVTRRLGEGERLLRSRTPWSFELGSCSVRVSRARHSASWALAKSAGRWRVAPSGSGWRSSTVDAAGPIPTSSVSYAPATCP
jgi:glyoxylate reductase